MPILVSQAASIVDGEIILRARPQFPPGDLIGFLMSLRPHAAADGPAWTVSVSISDRRNPQAIPMALEPFLSASQYERSFLEPICLASLETLSQSPASPPDERLWLFRDDIYAAAREPRASEREEVLLRIKALHFQTSDSLKRLREQVANFEAVESLTKNRTSRQPIPDDVKLLVWTRDGGVCVKCGASKELHFDHIIPLSRGGGDQAENIQLLCRACNLAKSTRLA